MRKLKLNLDQLQVTSFTPEPDAMGEPRGTVKGNSISIYGSVLFACAESVGGSCDSCYPNVCQPMISPE